MTRKGVRGLTLIELLVGVSIASALVFVGVPSTMSILDKQQLDSTSVTLLRNLHYARQYAVTHQVHVSVCPTKDGAICSEEWQDHYLVYVDDNGNSEQDSREKRVLNFQNVSEKWRLSWRAFGGKTQITYTPKGSTKHQNGSFKICPTAERRLGRMIHINKAGRGRLAADNNRDGLSETSRGKPMTCE